MAVTFFNQPRGFRWFVETRLAGDALILFGRLMDGNYLRGEA